MSGTVPFGCGQCLPCRINRRRLWTWRCFLESLCHPASSFVTLTYNQEHLPTDGSLNPKDVQDWLKRLRKKLSPTKVRYFLCGEYGPETFRPHYHASLFGIGQECQNLIQDTWGLGHTMTAEYNEHTAQYVAGYIIKKMTGKDDERLSGRYPEFARMSRKPGIGAPAISILGEALHTDAGLDEIARLEDVPMRLQIGQRSIPLGRYLRGKLRDEIGMPQEMRERAKARFAEEKCQEMLRLLSDPEYAEEHKKGAWGNLHVKANQGKIWSVERQSMIYKKRGTL